MRPVSFVSLSCFVKQCINGKKQKSTEYFFESVRAFLLKGDEFCIRKTVMQWFGFDDEGSDIDAFVEIPPKHVFFLNRLFFVKDKTVSYNNSILQTIDAASYHVNVDFLVTMRHEEDAVA